MYTNFGTGFTTVLGLTFDKLGRMYVLENTVTAGGAHARRRRHRPGHGREAGSDRQRPQYYRLE